MVLILLFLFVTQSKVKATFAFMYCRPLKCCIVRHLLNQSVRLFLLYVRGTFSHIASLFFSKRTDRAAHCGHMIFNY